MDTKAICIATNLVILFSTAWSCTMTDPCVDLRGSGETFAEPAQESSTLTSWSMSLTVDIGTKTYEWLELKRRMYNGQIIGPTITVKQGDQLTVTLTNRLSAAQDNTKELNTLRHPNTTNLHTHGLHISSKDPQDNVLRHIEPSTSGETYVYQIHANQPAGTYWYHSHVHGSTMFQVHGGLSGMLIVEDPAGTVSDSVSAVSCPGNCDKDIQLTFQPILQFTGNRGFGAVQDEIDDDPLFQHDSYILASDGRTTLTEWLAENINLYTTNGQVQPRLAMTTGQMYRFRMVNAGGDNTLELYVVDSADTARCTIKEIARDGVYYDQPRDMHLGQTLLEPAARVDWLVKCDTPGTYFIKSFADPNNRLSIGGITRYEGTLLEMTVSGTAVSPAQDFPTSLPAKPDFLADLSGLTQDQIDGRFVVELNPATNLNRERWSAGDYYRYKMQVGTVQEWFLTNTDTGASHPVHIHVNHFQITAWNAYTGPYADGNGQAWELFDIESQTSCDYQRAGQGRRKRSLWEEEEETLSRVKRQGPGGPGGPGGNADPFQFLGHDTRYSANGGNTLGYSTVGDWRDVALVPPLANLSVRFRVDEFEGDVIIHCHILHHEDTGMMMVVEAVAAGADTTANTPSGNAYPGTCGSCDRYPFNNPERLCDSATSIAKTDTALVMMILVHLLVFLKN